MIFDPPGKATVLKRNVYLIAATILGILLGSIVCSLVEIKYLDWAISRGDIAIFDDGYAALQFVQGIILIFGAIGGFFVGRFWWRKLYIERVWAKRR